MSRLEGLGLVATAHTVCGVNGSEAKEPRAARLSRFLSIRTQENGIEFQWVEGSIDVYWLSRGCLTAISLVLG